MRLLRVLMALQASKGAVGDADLEVLARREGVPLHHLEGLRSFYPVFREQAGAPVQVQVCRDVVCRLASGADRCQQVRLALRGRADVEVTEVSCIGLCDQAPAVMLDEQPLGGSLHDLCAYIEG